MLRSIKLAILIIILSTVTVVFANNCNQVLDINDITCEQQQVITSIFPERLHVGDTVGLVAPANRAKDEKIAIAITRLENLSLKVKLGKHIYDNYFEWAGTAQNRAKDINDMFADPEIKAIFAVRGGRGSYDILEYLDYALIKANPKIVMGFSDITALLLAIYTKTGLITFHGPMPGALEWPQDTIDYIKRVLFNAEKVSFANVADETIQTIHPGKARGQLFGGNIMTLTSRCGTSSLPDFNGAILFLEEDGESYNRISRCMSQLRDTGILGKIKGFVFGKCTECANATAAAKETYGQDDLLNSHIKPLEIPAYSNADIGHVNHMFTLPEGAEVEIDADRGTITMLEHAVK